MGYIICEKCGGYYELQPGEHPEDFDKCQCGGKLRYERKMINEGYANSSSGFKLPSSKNLKTLGIGAIAVLVLLVKFLPKSLILFWALLRFQNFDQLGMPYPYLIIGIVAILLIATKILRPLLR